MNRTSQFPVIRALEGETLKFVRVRVSMLNSGMRGRRTSHMMKMIVPVIITAAMMAAKMRRRRVARRLAAVVS